MIRKLLSNLNPLPPRRYALEVYARGTWLPHSDKPFRTLDRAEKFCRFAGRWGTRMRVLDLQG